MKIRAQLSTAFNVNVEKTTALYDCFGSDTPPCVKKMLTTIELPHIACSVVAHGQNTVYITIHTVHTDLLHAKFTQCASARGASSVQI